MKILTALLCLLPCLSQAQTDHSKLLDSLKHIREMPYICEGGLGCGDSIFWKVVSYKSEIVPYLIERINDTTQTEAYVVLFGGIWTVGDVAYAALEEIVWDLPTFRLLGTRFDKRGCGYCAYWKHINKSLKNREKFQRKVKQWYELNRADLVWVVSEEFQMCDCMGRKHPNGGHYELKKW